MRNRANLVVAGASFALMACSEATSTAPVQSSISQAAAQLDAQAYDVVDLGSFGGNTQALSIDKHGATFGRYTNSAGALRSFKWTRKDGFEDLGELDGKPFLILNTNDHGLLNGNVQVAPGVLRPVAWLPHEGFIYLDGENGGNTLGSNDRGAIAGTRFASGSSAAWVWTEDDGVQLLPLQISEGTILTSSASDVNDNGSVLGILTYRSSPTSPPQNSAFVWDAVNGTRLIPPLGPANVGATFISDEGIAVGASEMRRPLPGERRASPLASSPGDVPVHAWKWSESTGLVDLGTLGGNHSVAWDVDRDGNVYGWASDASNVKHAVKWTVSGGIVDLGTLGGDSLLGGLNKHGVLAGWSVTPSGETHAVQFIPRKK